MLITTKKRKRHAYNLTTLFERLIKGQEADKDVNVLKELILLERFFYTLSDELRVWLIDKKPKTIKEASKLADEFTVLNKSFGIQRQINNYRSAMPVEISISENKSKKYFDKNMKPFKNGTVLDNRYVPKVKSSAEMVCYRTCKEN